jgi:hypothetical protein
MSLGAVGGPVLVKCRATNRDAPTTSTTHAAAASGTSHPGRCLIRVRLGTLAGSTGMMFAAARSASCSLAAVRSISSGVIMAAP